MVQPNLSGLSVLIVDGQSLSAAEMSNRLTSHGARVHVVPNAAAAMLVTRAKRLDIAMIGFRIDGDTGALKRMLDEYGVPYVMCASATRADHVDYDRVFGLPLPSAA